MEIHDFHGPRSAKALSYYEESDLRFNWLKAALVGYAIDIVYRPGVKNGNADALSRNSVLSVGGVNLDLSRLEMYDLADKQVRDNPDEEAGAPPDRIFRSWVVKKQNNAAHVKVR